MSKLYLSEYRKRLCFWDDMLTRAIDKHSECNSELITFIINRVAILTKEAYRDFEYHYFYKQK